MDDIKLEFTPDHDGQKAELTILRGKALDPTPKVPIELSGNLTSVLNFAKIKKSVIEEYRLNSHLILNRSKLTATLCLRADEQQVCETITGELKLVKELIDLGINTEQHYTPKKLASKFKMLRWLFRDREEQAAIVSSLSNIDANIARTFKDSDDFRGNKALENTQKVTTNLPTSFILQSTIVEGGEQVTFNVDIELDALSDSVVVRLVSPDLVEKMQELVQDQFQKLEEELSYITVVHQ